MRIEVFSHNRRDARTRDREDGDRMAHRDERSKEPSWPIAGGPGKEREAEFIQSGAAGQPAIRSERDRVFTPAIYTVGDDTHHQLLQILYEEDRLGEAEGVLTDLELSGAISTFSGLNWRGLIELGRGNLQSAEMLLEGASACAATAGERLIAVENLCALKIVQDLPLQALVIGMRGVGMAMPLATGRGLWTNLHIAFAQLRKEAMLEEAFHVIAERFSSDERVLCRHFLSRSEGEKGGELGFLPVVLALDSSDSTMADRRQEMGDSSWATSIGTQHQVASTSPWSLMVEEGVWVSMADEAVGVVVRGG